MTLSVLLLLGLLSSTGSLPPPRVSFLLNSADRPLVLFSHPDIHNTTTLLLSDDESTLFVGARNALLSLDVSQSDVINLKKKVVWAPSQAEMSDCRLKGKNPAVDCPNFVHVLQPMNSSHLYACGSFAYNPHDAFIDTGSFSVVQQGGAKGRCPFSPFQRTTAITIDGELFTATTTNFRGDKAQISRHFSRGGRPDVSQDSSVSLLEEPTFVTTASDPTDRKLYFFFTEVGKEFSFVDELRIARVAQVCKDDVGGQRTLQRKWTSFAKASLLCQSPKQLPFNVLQDVFTLQPPEGSTTLDTQFFGVFTSQWSAGPESAVCVFRLQDVRQVFTESYRTFNMQTHQWSHTLGKHEYLGTCGLQNASDSHLAEVKRSFLTSNSVKPVSVGPVVVSREQRYSRVAAMTTETADGRHHTVLFLLTESGFLHKVVLSDQGARVIEEVQVFTQPQRLMSIVLSSTKGVLYVGTSEGVTAIPVANCSMYRSCSQCVLARDPLCGWSRTSRSCISLDTAQEKVAQDLENGNVEEECDGQTNVSLDTAVRVHLNEAVRLQCLRPSNLASLIWTSPQSNHLPEKLFIQSADATLSFLASASTFGMYRCVADEGGHKEVIRSYNVAPLRSMTPRSHNHHATDIKDETFEDTSTKEPGTSITQVSGEPDGSSVKGKGDEPTTFLQPETDSRSEDDFKDDGADLATTSREDIQFRKKWPDEAQRPSRDKSYYSEMVVVSLLLATCIFVLILAGLCTWRQKTTGLKVGPLVPVDRGSKTNQCLESIPSLSGSEDPEVKVEQ